MPNLAETYSQEYLTNHRVLYESRALDLEQKLRRVPPWQKALANARARITDPTVAGKIKKAMDLAVDNGIVFADPPKNMYLYRGDKYAKYSKGDVQMDLAIAGSVDSRGDFLLEAYRLLTPRGYSADRGARVMRIFVGTTTRVTNNVLKALLSKNND